MTCAHFNRLELLDTCLHSTHTNHYLQLTQQTQSSASKSTFKGTVYPKHNSDIYV